MSADRARWPKDDGPRLPKGQRRVRLYFVGHGKAFQIDAVAYSREVAKMDLGVHRIDHPDARIRRAYAAVRWIEP